VNDWRNKGVDEWVTIYLLLFNYKLRQNLEGVASQNKRSINETPQLNVWFECISEWVSKWMNWNKWTIE